MNGKLKQSINKLVIIESTSKDKVENIDYAGITFVKDAQQNIIDKT